MRYIKKQNNKIIEAPYIMIKQNKKIYGYNKISNEQMLIVDGYIKYDGILSLSDIDIIDGKIIEKPVIQPEKTTFSKLQIRRAARSLEKEDFLDAILSGNSEMQADWNDAQEIDLNDEMFTNLNNITEIKDFINEIKGILQ